MDISKEYILMCKKAKKIQKLWNPMVGDFVYYEKQTGLITKVDSCIGNPFLDKYEHLGLFLSIDGLYNGYIKQLKSLIWILRQDQLQEIIRPTIIKNQKNTYAYIRENNPKGFIEQCMIYDFYNWIYEDERLLCSIAGHKSYISMFYSMEQLWLAFIMMHKYNKIWNGKNWVVNG